MPSCVLAFDGASPLAFPKKARNRCVQVVSYSGVALEPGRCILLLHVRITSGVV